MSEHFPVLALDTCGAVGSVALVELHKDTDRVTCLQQVELAARTSAAQLMPSIASMLQQAELALRALRAIVVVNGPGSFTGVRVALSTAKGLAHASGVPIVAVSRLAVLANLSRMPECLAVLDAGRGEYYAGKYRAGQCMREWLASFDELSDVAQSGTPLVIAEQAVAARLAEWSPDAASPLDASAAAQAAAKRVLAEDWDDLARLDANYLRQSDAQLFARPPA